MKIEEFRICFADDVKENEKSLKNMKFFKYKDTIKNYRIEYENNIHDIRISVYDLEIVEYGNDTSVWNKIKNVIKDLNLLRYSLSTERIQFVKYLKVKYGEFYDDIEFQDREKPDFCVINNAIEIGFEVTEATDALNANYNKMMKKLSGRGLCKNDYTKYANEKHSTYKDNFDIKEIDGVVCTSPSKGLIDCDIVRRRIVEAVNIKNRKFDSYKTYEENNLIIVANGIGFSEDYDFLKVEKYLIENNLSNINNFDNIYVVNLYENMLVNYNKYGKLIFYKNS